MNARQLIVLGGIAAICVAATAAVVHTTAITGILMSGKMSVAIPGRNGVPMMDRAPINGSKRARTMKV